MDTTRATAARLEEARIKAGVSRLSLSEQSGIPRTTLNRILNGQTSASVDQVDRIAAALSVEPEKLVAFKGAAA